MAAAKQEVQKQQTATDLVVNNSFINGLTHQLEEKCKYGMSFPADYNLANALTGAYLVLKETKDRNNKPILESCSQASIANSLMDMATLGLSVQKKQGYFIAYGGQCQFQRSYFGNITIARRYGLKEIRAEVIYEGDEFSYHIEDGKKVFDSHKQDFMNIDTDKIKAAYAISITKSGEHYLEVMNMNQIKKAWAQGFGYKEGGNGTHAKFTDQMVKKTVINRALKMFMNTYGDGYMQEASDRSETVSSDDMTAKDMAYDIETKANKEEFMEDVPDTVEAETIEPEVVNAESIPKEVPEFMED